MERIKYYERTDRMLKAAIAKTKKGNNPKVFTISTEQRGNREVYVYPFEDMRPLIDTIVIPVDNTEEMVKRIKCRVRTQAYRKNIQISITHDEAMNAITVTRY